MKGLFIKDILGIRRYLRTLGVICVFFVVLSILLGSASYITSMLSIIFVMMPLTIFSYDESAKWDAYGLTMPVTRSQVVLGRYLLALIMMVVGTGIAVAASRLLSFLPKMQSSGEEMVIIICIVCGAGLFLLSVVLPMIYKFGAEKGRYIMMAVFLGILILVYLINQIQRIDVKDHVLQTGIYLLPVFGLLCFSGSYVISCRIYQNKEI